MTRFGNTRHSLQAQILLTALVTAFLNPCFAGQLRSIEKGEQVHDALFILSRQGQEEVNLDTTMLPLTRSLLVDERRKIR